MHHIVFVDDTPYNLELARAYLANVATDNLQVDYFDRAQVAISACKAQPPDLIFLDLEMPEKNGFETIHSLRSFCLAPIVAMTGHSEASIKDALLHHRFNDYLGKPFDEEALITLVRKYIRTLTVSATELHSESSSAAGNIGLNIAQMQQRLRNNHALITRILDSFQGNNTHTFAALISALESDDWISAKRICHTLKGGGANIGAEALSELSATLEVACGQRRHPTEQELKQLKQCIDEAISDCRQFIKQQAARH